MVKINEIKSSHLDLIDGLEREQSHIALAADRLVNDYLKMVKSKDALNLYEYVITTELSLFLDSERLRYLNSAPFRILNDGSELGSVQLISLMGDAEFIIHQYHFHNITLEDYLKRLISGQSFEDSKALKQLTDHYSENVNLTTLQVWVPTQLEQNSDDGDNHDVVIPWNIDLSRYPVFLDIFNKRLELQRELAALEKHTLENEFLISTTKKGLNLLEHYEFINLTPVDDS